MWCYHVHRFLATDLHLDKKTSRSLLLLVYLSA